MVLSATLRALEALEVKQFYAVAWTAPHIYHGKVQEAFPVQEAFLAQEGGPPDKLEFSFLARKTTPSNPSVIWWDWPIKADV